MKMKLDSINDYSLTSAFVHLLCKMSFIVWIPVFLACNAKSGGTGNSQTAGSGDTIKIEGCPEAAVKGKVGGILELKLEAVPGSGYQWLVKDSLPFLVLQDRDSLKFTKPDTQEPTPGMSGHQLLHFKMVSEGTGTLKLEYKRTWESELMNTCEMKIEVSKQ